MRKLAPARVSHWDDFQTRKHYACATHSSLPADRFHTEIGGRFAFTWYCFEILYRSEILAAVQESG